MTNTPQPKTDAPKSPRQSPPIARHREIAERIAAQLDEPHNIQILRLVQIFGDDLVERMAREAVERYIAPQSEPDVIDAAQITYTKDGKQRTLGGVFFALMRIHAEGLGVHWLGLFPPTWQKRNQANTQPPVSSDQKTAQPAIKSEKSMPSGTDQPAPINTNDNDQQPKPTLTLQPSQPKLMLPSTQSTTTTNAPKPTRAKMTIIGTLAGAPRNDAAAGLVELEFAVEMNSALPKGLPNLGKSRAVAICTRKQFDKIAEAQPITPQTRFIVEGEGAPAVNRDLQPFLKVVCIKLSTVELDQTARVPKPEATAGKDAK